METEFDAEEFCTLFDAALAEADRAARRAKPGFGAARDQAPLVAVDQYVQRMLDELAELRDYQRQIEEWLMSFPLPSTTMTASVGLAMDVEYAFTKLASDEAAQRFNADLLAHVRPPTLD